MGIRNGTLVVQRARSRLRSDVLAATLGDRVFVPVRGSGLSWRLRGFKARAGRTFNGNMSMDDRPKLVASTAGYLALAAFNCVLLLTYLGNHPNFPGDFCAFYTGARIYLQDPSRG